MASFQDKEIKHVVLLIAMEAEGKPLIEALGLHKIDLENKISPCIIYQGEYHNGTLSVVLNGKDKRYEVDSVGTTPGMWIDKNFIEIDLQYVLNNVQPLFHRSLP